MKLLLKQKASWILVITLCLPALATAQQPKTDDLFDEVPGKWKRVGGGDEITITIKDKNSKILNLEGLHRDWEGGFFDQSLGKWRFVRHPKPDEIAAYDPVTGKKLPDWVKKRVTRTDKGGELETGGIEWRFTFKVQKEARELVLVGEWYRGEVKWKELTDPQTNEVISQEALAYEADPFTVRYKKVCMTESDGEVIELAAANATLGKSGNIAESLRKIKFPADGAYWFAQLYYYITLYEIRDVNRFKHPAFVMHFIPIFYDLYAKNEELFEKGEFGKIAPQWRTHFEPKLVSPLDSKAHRPQVINTIEYTDAATMILVSGVTAHIKEDMSVALEKAYRRYAGKYCDALPFDDYHDDFFETNKPIFEQVRKALVGEMIERLGLVVHTEAALQVADRVNIGLSVDELYSWRETAWQTAKSNIEKSKSPK